MPSTFPVQMYEQVAKILINQDVTSYEMLALVDESDLKGSLDGATLGQRGIIRVVMERARALSGVDVKTEGKNMRLPFINIPEKCVVLGVYRPET